MTIIIKFFSSFCDSKHCKFTYENKLYQISKILNYGINKEIFITDEDNYTHVIILNTAMPILKEGIPKKNVIGMAFEPIPFLHLSPSFIEYAQKNISKYFIGDKVDLPDPFIEGQSFMWYSPYIGSSFEICKGLNIKKKRMSIIISQKRYAPGHEYRHKLVEVILSSNLPIDIYGRGHIYYKNKKDERIKGEFKQDSLEPYEEYDFHIAIENYQSNHYFSEKIIEPLLCNTTPIYLGCHNIETYFKNQVIFLSGIVEKDMQLIEDILKNPNRYKKEIDTKKVQKTVGLIENIENLFS